MGIYKVVEVKTLKKQTLEIIFHICQCGKSSKRQAEVNLSQFTMFIGALKPFIERQNKYVEFVGSW
jgi:hypothetical protein